MEFLIKSNLFAILNIFFRFEFSGQDYDEDELEKELEELEQQELDEHLLSVNTDEHALPDVPTGDITIPAAAMEQNHKSK